MLAARIKARLTQRELEVKLEYTSNMVSSYERGKQEPRLSTLVAFSVVLGCDVRDLVPASTSEADDPEIHGLDIPDAPPQYAAVETEEAPKPPVPPLPPAAKKTDRVDALTDRSGTMPWQEEGGDPTAW